MTPSNVRRTVVVAAASRHGSTTEIGDRVADRLRETLPGHWTVCRSEPDNTWSLTDADAVVLGSGIYYGRWLRQGRRALQRIDHHEYVWLFSSGPIGASDETEQPSELGRSAHHPHAMFGGCLNPSRLTRLERFVTRRLRVDAGDHRDWAAIDRWADGIADELTRNFDSDHHPEALADRADLHPTGARP